MSAKAALPPGVSVDSLAHVDELLTHNELGLALDLLADLADKSGAGLQCWNELGAAVAEMALAADDETHGFTVQLVLRRTTHHG